MWSKVGELHVKGKGKKAKRYVNLYVNRDYKVSILFSPQSNTESHRFEIKRIELRETLCYSVVRTYYYTVTRKHPFHFIGTFVSLLWGIYFLGKTLLFLT